MMIKTLQFILRSQIKNSKVMQKPGGFTLIELLVAAVITSLIITPLLGFMVSVMNTDRREQAKANSEQEIQTALNYISRDVQQAIYIYDQTGIEAIKDQLRYPTDAENKSPLLVFWKRELVPDIIPASDDTTSDAFVYSLVGYYLIKDSNPTWSKAARIARWKIKDGVIATTDGVTCTGYTGKYVNTDNCPSKGFAPFGDKLDEADTLEEGMNTWKKAGTYDDNAIVLIDYVDQSIEPPRPVAICPDSTAETTWSKIVPANKSTGFYVCVDRDNTTAQVFIRGNALARLNNEDNITYNTPKSTFFPTTSVRVEGRGFLFK